ncbi:MAG: hypothetical protein ACFFFT_04840 [Candidatus Thorarchaeota archaeon]
MKLDVFTRLGVIPPNKKITFYIFLLVPLIYPIVVLCLKYSGDMPYLFMPNDFQAYYFSSQLIFKDIESLYYNPGFFMPYRYFPISPILHFMYGIFPYDTAYIVGLFLIYFQTVLVFLIVLKIAKEYFNHDDKEFIWLFWAIGLIVIVPYNIILYLQIQTSISVILTILLGYYYFKKEEHEFRNNLIGGIFIAVAILLKPTIIIVIPFLIDAKIDNEKIVIRTPSFLRIIPTIIMLIINIIIFIVFPTLLYGFFQNNFHHIYIEFNYLSDSLTTFLARIFSIHPTILFIIICGTLFLILYYHFLTKKNDLIYYLALSILISLISYIDVWNHSILFLLPLIMFIIMKTKSQEHKSKLKMIYYITIGLSYLNVFNFYFSVNIFQVYYSLFTLYYPILFYYMYKKCRPSSFYVD